MDAAVDTGGASVGGEVSAAAAPTGDAGQIKPSGGEKAPAKGASQSHASTKETVVTAPSWVEGLKPEHKEYVSTKGFQDPSSVLESYINLEKLRGVPQERLLKLPESAEAEGWGEVYSKLGKPATPEGYGILPAEGADPAFSNWAKESFHKLNFTETQAKGLLEKFNDFNATQAMAEKEQYDSNLKKQEMSLRKDWGAAYHQNVANAQRAQSAFNLPETAIAALEKTMGLDGLMKFMNDIGSKIGEHSFVGGERQSGFGEGVLTPDQAKAKIGALKRDHSFTKKFLAGDVDAKNKMSRLHEMAYPSD